MRIRHIKPEFWEDEHLAEVSRDARLLFAGLWNMADAEGKIKATSKLIKGQLFRYDDDVSSAVVESWLCELSNHSKKFIVRYEVDGQSYIFVSKFLSHQRPDPREKSKSYPDPTSPNLEKQCSDNVLTMSEHTPNCMGTGYLVLGTGILGSCSSDSSESNDEISKQESEPKGFLEFWDKYPRIRRVARADCLKFWKANKLEVKAQTVLDGLDRWIASHDWVKEGGKYVKQPDGWLKGKKWIDYPMPNSEAPPPKQPYQIHSTALPGNQITPAHLRQSGVIDIS